MTIVENKRVVLVSASLVTYLKAAALFASTDAARTILGSVYFECDDGKLRLTATDSYALMCMNTDVECDDFEPFIVRAAEITAALKVITGKGVMYAVTCEAGKVTFQGAQDITFNVVEGDYPNYGNLIPDVLVPQSVCIAPKYYERLAKATTIVGALSAEYVGGSAGENKRTNGLGPQVFLINGDTCELLVMVMPVRKPSTSV